ncbi:MAG TPA: BadF/BadG/BcrA/BcrD ATPase family protein [Blastocatellia bacterium]|nr:BadF/BadG/BcrA/BcrD ATPase family protein [Blastocatellia bacterium]
MPEFFASHSARSPHSTATASLDPDEETAPGGAKYFLGVDGGGTKTHAVITDAYFKVIGEGMSGASNPLRAGLEEAITHIESAVLQACLNARIKIKEITAACVALAGINHPIHYHTMKDSLDRALRIENLQLVTDVRAALIGALDSQPGIVVIAGTGSIAMGMNGSGEEVRSGGWGPTLGDEGSGYDIARRALKAVAASFDGRSPQTVLTERFCRKLGVASAADLPGVIYNSDSEPVEIASLAELVSEAALEGDPVACEILEQAGLELGQLAISVIERLGLERESFLVACVGSVFLAGEPVLRPFREAVLSVAPGARVGAPLFAPAIGAAKLARVLA